MLGKESFEQWRTTNASGVVWSRGPVEAYAQALEVPVLGGGLRTLVDALVAFDRELILEGRSVYRVVQLEQRVDGAVLRALTGATPDVWTPDEIGGSAPAIEISGEHARERLARYATDPSIAGQLECALAYRHLGDHEECSGVLDRLRQRLDHPVRRVEAEALVSLWNRVDNAGREKALEQYREHFGEDETWVRYRAFLQVFVGELRPEIRDRIASYWFDPELPPRHRAGFADLVIHEAALVGPDEVLATLPTMSKPLQVQVLERVTGTAERLGLDGLILTWVPRLLSLRADIGDRVPGSSLLLWLMLTGDTVRGRLEADRLIAYPAHMLLVQGFFRMLEGDEDAVRLFREGLLLSREEGYQFGEVVVGACLAATDPTTPFDVVRRAEIHAPAIGTARFSADVCRRAAASHVAHRVRWLGVARVLMEGDGPHAALESELQASDTRPVGDFDLTGELGKGGAGVVYRAIHRPTETAVALKLLHSARDAGELAAEASVQGRLFHPAVLRVLAAGQVEPCHAWGEFTTETGWMAMELASGGSLFQSGRRPTLDLLPVLLVEILDALAHCHARGVLHLDLKPANLLLDEHGRVRLADFGIAGALGRRASRIRGTPAYSAPEVWEGGVLDQRTDLYALGCVVYDLVVGMPPFMGSTKAVRSAHLIRPFPKTDTSLDPWLERLTAKNPSKRYRSAAAALAALPTTIRAQVLKRRKGRTISATFTLDLGAVVGDGSQAEVVGELQRLPADWRPRGWHTEWQLPRRGLGPLEAREVSLTGREVIQDSLWAALHRVASGEGLRVALMGDEGVGRAAIARWLTERVRELDVAETTMAGAFPRVIDLGEDPRWPEASPGVLHLGICTVAPAVDVVIPVPALSNAALQQLALLWSVVEPHVLDSAVAHSIGPADLRRALTEAPEPSPMAPSGDPNLGAAQEALKTRDADVAAAALEAFRVRTLDPSHLPTLGRIRDAAVAMGLPSDHRLFGELAIARLNHASRRKIVVLANAVRRTPHTPSPWDEARVLAACLLAVDQEAEAGLPEAISTPWARWWVAYSRAIISMRHGRQPDFEPLRRLGKAHPLLPGLDSLLAECNLLFGGALSMSNPYWQAWSALMMGRSATGEDRVLDLVQALLNGVDYPDGVFQPLVLPLDEPVRVAVLMASGAGDPDSPWETLLSRLSRPLPDLAGRVIGWSAARAAGIPGRRQVLEDALDRLAGHPLRACAWRRLPGIWSIRS